LLKNLSTIIFCYTTSDYKNPAAMSPTPYETQALNELLEWQHRMQRMPGIASKLTRKVQYKLNSYIPDKIHAAITATIKQMTRAVLFGAGLTTRQPALMSYNLFVQEEIVRSRIKFYRNTAAAEGGVTGAGGILLGLADFPLLLGLKLKLLSEIAALYGFSVQDYKERVFLLYVFQLAFSSQQHRRQVYQHITNWENQKHSLPDDVNQFEWRAFQQEYRDYIDIAKMAQLIPIIGAPIGAITNYKLINTLGDTAMNAYRMRLHEANLL
jgi:hypothetical protein